MRTERAGLLCLGIALLTEASLARADDPEPKDNNPYQVILVRNPFGLKDPPAPPDPSTTNLPPVKVDLKFTGITAHSGGKKAWFMIPPKPGSKDPKYLSMEEGDKDGDIQVLEIDEVATTVKILNAGVPVVLNFRENGLAAPTALAVAGPVGNPGPGMRTPIANPGAPPPAANYAPASSGGLPPPTGQATFENSGNASPRTIPSRSLRTTPIEPGGSAGPTAPIDPAVQYIQLKAQEHAAKQQGISLPPIPE